jgi:hypothetical protein
MRMQFYLGKPERERLLRRPGRRWKDNIEVNCKETARKWNALSWISSETSGRLYEMVMHVLYSFDASCRGKKWWWHIQIFCRSIILEGLRKR